MGTKSKPSTAVKSGSRYTWDIGPQIHLVSFNDTNPHGTIFGGKVMELADQVGAICARRYSGSPVLTASLDRIDFLHPIFVGEEAHVTPRLIYAYQHSMQVGVEVRAVDPIRGLERKTARIRLTYVAIDPLQQNPARVPSWKGEEPKEAKAFRQKVEAWRNGRALRSAPPPSKMKSLGTKPGKEPEASLVENHHLVMPGDQNSLGLLFAGRYLSWIDILGALSAGRHAGRPVVTASIEEVHFRERVPKGSTLRMVAKPVFCAQRSMQIQATGWLWCPNGGRDRLVAEALLTFVALDDQLKRPVSVPALIPKTAEEKKAYLEGQGRYERLKRLK